MIFRGERFFHIHIHIQATATSPRTAKWTAQDSFIWMSDLILWFHRLGSSKVVQPEPPGSLAPPALGAARSVVLRHHEDGDLPWAMRNRLCPDDL